MVPPTLRCMTKTRSSSLSRCLFSNNFTSDSSSNISPFSPPSSLTINPSSITKYQFKNPSPESSEIASSFRDWFRTSKIPVFDRIFLLLNSKDDTDLQNLDLGLSQLGLRLNEVFVLDVLRYKSNDVLSCLKFFDWAGRQSYFHHTRSTYIAIFKILSRAKLKSLTLDLLHVLGKHTFIRRVRFNDVLVIGYAMAGKIDIALQVFGRMRFRGIDLDKVAYNVLLNALVDNDSFDSYKIVLEQIRTRGFENSCSHFVVIKCMCKQGQLVEAEEYLRDLLSRGYGYECGHVFAMLVNALCKNRRFLVAGKLIHEFGENSDVPMEQAYGTLIRALVDDGQLDEAVEFINSKKSLEGYVPDVYRYNILLNKLLMQDRLQEVCDMLMEMKASNIVPDKATMNAVLCFFCKAGMTDVALDLYSLKSEFGFTPHGLVYNYVINSLCGDGNADEAFRLLRSSMSQGYFPQRKTFTLLADALCRESKLDNMKDLIMFALERKFMPSDYTYEKFIRALCRANRVEDGYLIHGELSRLNKNASESTYSYLISGFIKAKRGDLAATLLIEMQQKGHKPSPRLFKNTLYSVCEMNDDKHYLQLLEMQLCTNGHDVHMYNYFIYGAGHARRCDLGRLIFDLMFRFDVVPNLCSDIYMLQCYMKSGKIDDSLDFFAEISKRKRLGRKLYNSMVVGLCKAGRPGSASAILKEARSKGLVPSLQCYEELIKLFCSRKEYDEAIILINDMEKVGRKVSSFIGNALLFYSLHSEDLHKAWLRSRDVSKQTSSTAMLGQVIAAFSGRIWPDCNVEELEEIIHKCFPPDLYSYNMLLRKLTVDHIDGACQLFKRLCQKGMKPNRWTYNILVHGLYKHGRIAEGLMWAEEMYRRGHLRNEHS